MCPGSSPTCSSSFGWKRTSCSAWRCWLSHRSSGSAAPRLGRSAWPTRRSRSCSPSARASPSGKRGMPRRCTCPTATTPSSRPSSCPGPVRPRLFPRPVPAHRPRSIRHAAGHRPTRRGARDRAVVVPTPAGVRDVTTNLATGPYLVDVDGAEPIGRTPSGWLVLRRPKDEVAETTMRLRLSTAEKRARGCRALDHAAGADRRRGVARHAAAAVAAPSRPTSSPHRGKCIRA